MYRAETGTIIYLVDRVLAIPDYLKTPGGLSPLFLCFYFISAS